DPVTQSTSRGCVEPRNFTVTCWFWIGTHRAFGNRSRTCVTASASAPRTSSGISTAANSRIGLASGRDARSRAIIPSPSVGQPQAEQVAADQVERGQLGEPADELAVVR